MRNATLTKCQLEHCKLANIFFTKSQLANCKSVNCMANFWYFCSLFLIPSFPPIPSFSSFLFLFLFHIPNSLHPIFPFNHQPTVPIEILDTELIFPLIYSSYFILQYKNWRYSQYFLFYWTGNGFRNGIREGDIVEIAG
jgi:hypothetical protein